MRLISLLSAVALSLGGVLFAATVPQDDVALGAIAGGTTIHDDQKCDNEATCNKENEGTFCNSTSAFMYPACNVGYNCVTNCENNYIPRGKCVPNPFFNCREGSSGPCGDGEKGICVGQANHLLKRCEWNGCPGGGASATCSEMQFACYNA